MTNRHVQKFPSGEVRIFEGDEGEPMLLIEHKRAPGDTRTANMIGKREDQLPAPFEAVHE